MTYPGGRTLTVYRLAAGPLDAHGNATRVRTPTHQIDNCLVAPPVALTNAGKYEPAAPGRTPVNEIFTVYAPPGADIGSRDEVDLDGKRYEVIGEPGSWPDPWTGITEGVVFAMERRQG